MSCSHRPSLNDKTFEKSWDTIVEWGFSRLFFDEERLIIPYHEQDPIAYGAVISAIRDLCAISSTASLYLLEKLYTNIREQIEYHLTKRVLPKVKASERPSRILEVLVRQWHNYRRFKEWLDRLFCRLDQIMQHRILEDRHNYDTVRLANVCFKDIVVSPLLPSLRKQVSWRFDNHFCEADPKRITCMADFSLLSDVTSMLNAISTPESDIWEEFRKGFVLNRGQTYHRVGLEWVKSHCFEEFASCIISYSESEKLAGRLSFGREVGKTLHHETKRVLFGIYLPRIFWKSKGLYKIWIKERNLRSLEQVNRAIIGNRNLVKEVTEIFRVEFMEEVCSALQIDCKPFVRINSKVASPFHICCTNDQVAEHDSRPNDLFQQATTHVMLKSFERQAALLESFSAAKCLKNKCKKILQSYIDECTKCRLPNMVVSFCRFVLAIYGEHVENSAVYFCHSQVRSFLNFVPRPDRFQKAYCEDLYETLMHNKLAPITAEQLIVSAFSNVGKHGCIRQGERMLRDYKESKSLFDQFVNSSFYSDFGEQFITPMLFKVNLFREGTLNRRTESFAQVPQEIRAFHLRYEGFFTSRYADAKLKWDCMLGTVRIHTTLFSDGKRGGTELELNVDQYSVLNLFQVTNNILLRSIAERLIIAPTGTSDWKHSFKILVSVIKSMMFESCPLLRKDPKTSNFMASDTIKLNSTYVSQEAEIKVTKPDYDDKAPRCVVQQDSDAINLQRIETSVMRTMKELRRASREGILVIVTKKLARFGHINIKLFDKALETLIEREFIQREEGGPTCFSYIP